MNLHAQKKYSLDKASSHVNVIEYDKSDWISDLKTNLGNVLSITVLDALSAAKLEYRENALEELEIILGHDTETLIDQTINWVKSKTFRVFHGTRLTDAEVEAVLRDGLVALDKESRIDWLYQEYPEIEEKLPRSEASEIAHWSNIGGRENQVHVAISRQLMLYEYDYLFQGSEFDRRFLEHGKLDEVLSAIKQRGKPRLISVLLSGESALAGAHPIFSIEDVRANDRFPNFIRELLTELAWQLYKPGDKRYNPDCCMMFHHSIPSSWIERIETVSETVETN